MYEITVENEEYVSDKINWFSTKESKNVAYPFIVVANPLYDASSMEFLDILTIADMDIKRRNAIKILTTIGICIAKLLNFFFIGSPLLRSFIYGWYSLTVYS